jgi:hypothetical protein
VFISTVAAPKPGPEPEGELFLREVLLARGPPSEALYAFHSAPRTSTSRPSGRVFLIPVLPSNFGTRHLRHVVGQRELSGRFVHRDRDEDTVPLEGSFAAHATPKRSSDGEKRNGIASGTREVVSHETPL